MRAVRRGLPRVLLGGFGLGASRQGPADPGITITPSIGVSQAYTGGVTAGHRPDPDLVSQISPGININGETARTKVNFNDQPTFNNSILGHSDGRIDEPTSLQNSRFLNFDQFGNAIDSRTGLPLSSVNQSFGSQNILFRDKPASISISHDFARSAISVSAQYEDRVSLNGPLQKHEICTATVSYTREFTPLLQGNVRAAYTYGISSSAGSLTIHKQGISVSAALFYQLSDSVTVAVVENYYKNTSDFSLDESKTQQLTVGLRKSF